MAIIDTNDIAIDGNILVGKNIINDALSTALDGYSVVEQKSIFIKCSSGTFEYNTAPIPDFRRLNLYWNVASLDGSYSSGTYQSFYSDCFNIPLDYNSGGIFKIYGFLDSTSGAIYISEGVLVATRIGSNSQTGTWYTPGNISKTTNMDQDIVYNIYEINVTGSLLGGNIEPGDIVQFRIQRLAGNVNDTASSGYLGIIGAEFFYNANIPKKTY